MPLALDLCVQAVTPSNHLWSKILLRTPPPFLNQAPPGAQQLSLPDFSNVLHFGHVISLPGVMDVVLMLTSTVACSKCGTFTKSRRVSCCAPGGAWYKNCGGASNRDTDHRWFDGVEACKRKFHEREDVGRFLIIASSDCFRVPFVLL